jgi:hypothetical protein
LAALSSVPGISAARLPVATIEAPLVRWGSATSTALKTPQKSTATAGGPRDQNDLAVQTSHGLLLPGGTGSWR